MRTTSDQSQLACLREEVKKLHTELNDVKGNTYIVGLLHNSHSYDSNYLLFFIFGKRI